MKRIIYILMVVGVVLVVGVSANPAVAEIVTTGDVVPATDPATWTSSTMAYIGKTGNGTMNITSGSDVSDWYGRIGYDPGSTGEVTVDGTGSTWTTSEHLDVGLYGSGVLTITNGGAVSAAEGTVGLFAGSTGEATVNGTGSTWTNSQALYVGYSGSGVLNITGGGAVSSVDSSIGYIPYPEGSTDSTGVVTVDGVGSTWMNSSTLNVGFLGSGVLNITNGGVVSNGDGHIGRACDLTLTEWGEGEVTVDGPGSMWTNNGDLSVGNCGGGVLNITDGGLVSVGGTLSIDYSIDYNGGYIDMTPGGMLALYGKADHSLGDFLGLIDGTGEIYYGNHAYTLTYYKKGGGRDLAGYTVLTILELVMLLGDANHDGMVSADDYASIQIHFGDTGAPGILGDANWDGVVSADDFGAVGIGAGNCNFGCVYLVPHVPEPTTLGVLLVGGLAMLRRCSAQVLKRKWK